MKQAYYIRLLFAIFVLCISSSLFSQTTIKGIVMDPAINDPVIGATILIKESTTGTATDWDGTFELTTDLPFPFTVEVAYLGYVSKEVVIEDNKRLTINLEEEAITIDAIEIKASRISDKQRESPLTIEALDNIAIKETPAADFYDGLGALKGVDLTAASLGFKVVNTRGFNSTSPVRSLQIIDGVDNQA
ncbi:MAG: iron complex outermembrane receptor protein, partial [Saprospiraceae bacterium]